MSELLEKILNRENMNKAYKRVKANKGTSGIDEITIEDAYVYIKENWESIRAEITERKHQPQPVKRVEIPKPNGGTRNLGIPTVMDRIIPVSYTHLDVYKRQLLMHLNDIGIHPDLHIAVPVSQKLK